MSITKSNTRMLDGTIGASQLDDTLDLSSKTVTLPAASVEPHVSAGAIKQVVTHVETGITTFTQSSTNRADNLLLATSAADGTSHVSATITPTATTSKILIQVCVFYEGTRPENDYLWDIYRDSTKLGQPRVGNRGGGIASQGVNYTNDQASTPETIYYQFVDTPTSTSPITYAAAYNVTGTGGTLYLNRTVQDVDAAVYERGVSSIVVMEIAG